MFVRSKCFYALLSLSFFFFSCAEKKKEPVLTPWGEVQTDSIPESYDFTVSDMVSNGEMIMLTISGPDTYYDYHGRGMGMQYLLCENFAHKLGVSVRVELCKDTLEMIDRLNNGDADIIAFPLPKNIKAKDRLLFCGAGVDSLGVQWAVAPTNKELADSLNSWFKPSLIAEVQKEERYASSSHRVKRRVYAPFLNRSGGVISHYDHLFKKYAPVARWDWRLMAAQCYQESCFDPQAQSWAGARGLMQIMPATASYLGLPMSSIHEPEANVRAAAKYINELSGYYRNIQSPSERQLFVLASYNGGYNHIQDAMALARKNGKNPHRWRDVAYYVLALEKPQYYNDPIVKYGYMRGSETVDYVDRIRQRYAQYRGVPYGGASVDKQDFENNATQDSYSPYVPHKAKKKHRFKL
ncbi:MAG: transglycosylase SLT domain-containing protein [Prevotellaceae bacterium]|nr:transglycosylase SLT domain-containing protein [Prevotellaceae bacterium]